MDSEVHILLPLYLADCPSIQGLTTTDKAEKKFLLDQLVACDGGTGVMHESFHVDDPTLYSREWFSWANMMFCELVLDYLDIR